jgi:hypothetical protein
MPMSARTRISAGSGIVSTRSPLTWMAPESGRRSPRMSFSVTDFPAPLSPSRTVIVPFGTVKLMSWSTGSSSKAKETPSNSTAGGGVVAPVM